MKTYIYSVWDRVGGFYRYTALDQYPPEVKKTLVERDVKIYGVDPKEGLEDCEIYIMGNFEDTTGEFEILPKPQFMLRYIDFIKKGDKKDEELESLGRTE